MFNSVAKYLWGSAGDEAEDLDQRVLEASQPSMQNGGDSPVSLSVDVVQEDDWVLVSNADKENRNTPVVPPSHLPLHHHQPHHLLHHHYHHQHHHHLHQQHQQQHHHQSHHSSHDNLSQQQWAEAELLDEASSLVTDTSCPSHPSQDGDNKSLSDDTDDNGIDSGMRPSSPESVFSACSGRSSATYRPRGVDSEAWIVAPPPCFTGSQCGSLSPLVSSPLENLLIEHPSMSVYVSQPALVHSATFLGDPFAKSQGIPSVLHISESSAVLSDSHPSEAPEVEASPVESERREDRLENSLQSRRSGETAIHQHPLTQKRVLNLQKSAQLRAIQIAQRPMSKHKLRHQNRSQEVRAVPKGRVNHRSKQMRPSGFRCSRTSQRSNAPKQFV